MGRRRLQLKGNLFEQGGWWKLRWMEDQRKADGTMKYGWSKVVWIGPSVGAGRLTKPQAHRFAWENFLSRLDQNMRNPQSVMTLREFVERRFIPEHVDMLKPAGRKHYRGMLAMVLDGVPKIKISGSPRMKSGDHMDVERFHGIGKIRVRDVDHEDVQRLISAALRAGYSIQTALHMRTCVSAIFNYAEGVNWFSGKNPAKNVKLPEMVRKEATSLSFDQLKALLASLEPLPRAMVLCAAMTSMNVAEVCGLRWKRVNFSGQPVSVDGEPIPAYHLAVREQWYLRQWGSVKKRARRRVIPMNSLVMEALADLRAHTLQVGPSDPVFAGIGGQPVDSYNIMRRYVLKAGAALGITGLGWHTLRRTFATLTDEIGMTPGARQALMGHRMAEMTSLYTKTPTEQTMASLEEMARKVRVN